MEQLPLDARGVLEELRASASSSTGALPRTWVPSASFQALLADADVSPLSLNEHLTWLHEHGDLAGLLAPPAGTSVKAWAKRQAHRVVLAILEPYLVRVQDCIAVTVRAIDAVARRVDEQGALQLRTLDGVRADLVDLARNLEEQLVE